MARKKPKLEPVYIQVPLYHMSSMEDLNKGVERLVNPDKAPKSPVRFFSSVRYPDEHIDIRVWENDPSMLDL